mmetsp:Transcript_114172/g.368870  ORF Transcript_114172/g.368870 Transcript_114172/m.368870 type:complete len:254 (-) Transcript_114172:54-815(-)
MGAELSCDSRPSAPEPVILQIYDVSGNPAVQRVNKLFRAVGTGAFHAGVEVYGREWSFGFTEEGAGVFCCPPRGCGAHAYREALAMGFTNLTEEEVDELIEQLKEEWPGMDYDLLHRNCCHFSSTLCQRLGVGPVPPWVTNLAAAGATLNKGIKQAAERAQAAAIIARAKAGEIDAQYQIRGKVDARARDLLARAGQLDGRLGITRGVTAASRKLTREATGLLDAGKQARGAEPSDSYKFGDLTRGVLRKAGR